MLPQLQGRSNLPRCRATTPAPIKLKRLKSTSNNLNFAVNLRAPKSRQKGGSAAKSYLNY
jgi:hypothetical protein